MNIERKPKVALMSYVMDKRGQKGTALYTKKLIEGLLDNNKFDFYLVHYDKTDSPLYKKAKEIIMPKIKLPFGSRFVSQLLFFWKYRKEPFDVVHWFQPRLYPFYSLVPAKKIIITMHGGGDVTAQTHFIFSRSVFNFVLTRFHKSVDIVIADSDFGKYEIAENYGIPEEKIRSIYLGEGENFRPIDKNEAKETMSKKYGLTGHYILDVSRLQPHKNIVMLIKAYDNMRKKYSGHTEKLVIVGAAGYNRRDEYIAAEESPFSKDIMIFEVFPREDLNNMYSGSDLFVFPSLNEGFGFPIVEAMASGVPVITSNITSMPEIGGEAVITIDPFNKEELMEAMHKVLTDENIRKRMIELGLSRAKIFTWQKTVEETEKLYTDKK